MMKNPKASKLKLTDISLNMFQPKRYFRNSDGGGVQIWSMLEEANNAFKINPPLAIIYNSEKKAKTILCVEGSIFVHSSLYKALQFTYLQGIGGHSHDCAIKTVMGQGSMGEVVGVLDQTMFKPDSQP